jgi:methylated-DNA-protein-cysteine methyltransferase related protein
MKKKNEFSLYDSGGNDREKGWHGQFPGFFSKVYDLVEQIPEGRVMTYGQIAALLGHPRGARLVGWAMHSVPGGRLLPCHRVVNKTGTLAPSHIFGEDEQRKLLEKEGVTFRENGSIDMKKHLWVGD